MDADRKAAMPAPEMSQNDDDLRGCGSWLLVLRICVYLCPSAVIICLIPKCSCRVLPSAIVLDGNPRLCFYRDMVEEGFARANAV